VTETFINQKKKEKRKKKKEKIYHENTKP